MAKRTISPTPVPTPRTRALLAFNQNLDSIKHMLALHLREAKGIKAHASRFGESLENGVDLATKPARAKLVRSLNRFVKTLETRRKRLETITLWQVVMMVTCVEAFLQDVLTAAAGVDPELMSKSEQRALYADVIAASSLETLANDLRARWARGWLSDGGPSRWIERLGKMGARGYPDDVGPRLERFWGVRHVVVHTAGVATTDFVKRHPGVVAAAGDRVRANSHDLKKFLEAISDFMDPTEAFFLARYPSMLVAASAGSAK